MVCLVLYVQTGAGPMLVVAGGAAAALVFVIASFVLTRRGKPGPAGLSLIVGGMIAGAASVFAWKGVNGYVLSSGVSLIVLVGLIALPRRWVAWAIAIAIETALVVLIERYTPLVRYDIARSLLLRVFVPTVAGFSVLGALARIVLAYRQAVTIRVRMMIAFVLTALLPLVAVAGISILGGLAAGRAQLISKLESVLALKEFEVQEWSNELQVNLDAEYRRDPAREKMIELLSIPLGSSRSDARQGILRGFRQALNLQPLLRELFIISSNGTVILSTDSAREGASVASEDFFLRGLHQAIISSPYLDPSRSRGVVVASRPIVDDQGIVVGVLAARGDLTLPERIMAEYAGMGKTGETYLLSRDHTALTPRRFGAVGASVWTWAAAEAIEKERSGSGQYPDYRNVPVIGVFHWLSWLGVAIVAEEDQEEANASTYLLLRASAAAALGFTLLAVLASLLFSRSISIPLAGLSRTATRIANGDLERAAEASRGDEVGALARALNLMTERLSKTMAGLREGEARYRNIFMNSAVSLWEQDITELRAIFRQLRFQGVTDLEAHAAAHPEFVPMAIRTIKVIAVNDRTLQLYEADSAEKLLGPLDATLAPEAIGSFTKMFAAIFNGQRIFEQESWALSLTGKKLDISIFTYIPGESNESQQMLVSVLDISERRKAERERERLEEQLRQGQKMEAIGRLAGGIAHDFNNLLTVIAGYCDVLVEGLEPDAPLRSPMREIRKATDRAIDLTAQLLAFGRKQLIQPRTLSLNDVVRGMANMLHRVLGEDIELLEVLDPDAGNIMADQGRVEQVIMNLATNARDAMPSGGRLTIETSNRILDHSYARDHPETRPGEYVMLAVGDVGVGMDAETLTHIFEPFFTTKEKGKGTGLGLATTYGIVKQSGGHIYCYSEPGLGTTFKIYFPRIRGDREREERKDVAAGNVRGSESILVVEDEDALRRLIATILRKNGYTVWEAADGPQALTAMAQRSSPVDILVTDVVMPKMNGRDLARDIAAQHPGVKVLFVSGYAEDAIVHQGIVDPGINFIQKPFAAQELLSKIRSMLGPEGSRQ